MPREGGKKAVDTVSGRKPAGRLLAPFRMTTGLSLGAPSFGRGLSLAPPAVVARLSIAGSTGQRLQRESSDHPLRSVKTVNSGRQLTRIGTRLKPTPRLT